VTGTTAPPTVVLDRYDDVREALFNPHLSRTFDERSYEEGNIRDGIVSVSHGAVHRARRRVENSQFRPDVLRLYERELFPQVLSDLLDTLIHGPSTDLFSVGEHVSVVLAALRAGIDIDPTNLDHLRDRVRYVDVVSQAAAILDARDPDAVREMVRAAYETFDRDWIAPSWERRTALIERHRAGQLGPDDLPHDILTVLLLHQEDPALALTDRGRIVREVATYLQGGTHTSAQTLVNAFDLLFAAGPSGTAIIDRAADDLALCQRIVHETLRLRPTTPRMRRRAVAATTIAGRAIDPETVVILDAQTANRDPQLFGTDPDDFDPDREVDPNVARWGLSFGAGAHQCPGRSVAGGFPASGHGAQGEDHIYGLVALEVREISRRRPRPDPERPPERDTRTERHTRWARYWVAFEG
jgi:cytochrome P450